MKDKLYELSKKVFVLPAWLTVLIAVPSFLALIFFFLFGKSIEVLKVLEVPLYCLSFYALVISCTGISQMIHIARNKLNKAALWIRLREDTYFRTTVTMLPSLLLNAVYVVSNIGMGILNRATWFVYLGIYYLLLVSMKSYLLHGLIIGKGTIDEQKEYRKYRNCGISLLLMNMVLNAECVYIVQKNQNYHYAGVLIYVMAAMTFYSLITAIVNLVRYRRYKSPVLSAVKVINLTTAMVTMLALETAMLSQFGSTDEASFRQIMTSLTSGVICIVEFVMAIYMIYHGTRRLKQKQGN